MIATEAILWRRSLFCCAILALLVAKSDQYVQNTNSNVNSRRVKVAAKDHTDRIYRRSHQEVKWLGDSRLRSAAAEEGIPIAYSLQTENDDDAVIQSTEDLNDEMDRLLNDSAYDEAFSLLNRAEAALIEGRTDFPHPNHLSYTRILTVWAAANYMNSKTLQIVEELFERMKNVAEKHNTACQPTRVAYNAVILAWSKSYSKQAGERCDELLTELWSKYNTTRTTVAAASPTSEIAEEDSNIKNPYCPSHSTYVSTLTALARSGGGKKAAERAEQLLEEMERFSGVAAKENPDQQHLPHLKPTTTCVNIVLNAWSKSGAHEARERCERALRRMEKLYFGGRTELQPNTISFNTVLDAMAQCNERGSARRAEQLLEHMDELSNRDEGLRETCRPDALSFNSVLNGWARSREPTAANRADSILKHMEQRFEDGSSYVKPDVQTYNTVLTAWARSRNKDTMVQNAQQVLQRMEKAYRQGNAEARPNRISYNIIINALAQSSDPAASDRALEILETMKKLDSEDGVESCRPDTVTYTTIMNVFAKKLSNQKEAAETAISLLEELEDVYLQTGDQDFKPNIRTYTAAIHAIARSRFEPQRAEEIVLRLEKLHESGDTDVQPDCVCYDALINAFGWSDMKGKSLKCYSIYQKMLNLYKSRRNVLAKPDIITCNSVLNACAYESVETDEERDAIMDVVVKTLESFQSAAPKFGWTNHITYANTLQAINKQVLDEQKRTDLAEATFWRCCQNGHVSVLVVTSLHRALTDWERFSGIMSEALSSGEGEPLHFNWKKLPREWTRFAPQPKERRDSRPSQKRTSRSSKPSTIRLESKNHS